MLQDADKIDDNIIEFWFDFASTYSYPAAMRIESLAKNNGLQIKWCPFLLGPIFIKQGWDDSPFNIYPVKGEYMWRDLERLCQEQQIPFSKPSTFPQIGLLAARVVNRFSNEAWAGEFVKAIYTANFAKGQDISSRDVVKSCLIACLDGADKGDDTYAELILVEANSEESKGNLRLQTEEAQQRGIFGAPSFMIGDEMFWGNDRLENAVRFAASRKKENRS